MLLELKLSNVPHAGPGVVRQNCCEVELEGRQVCLCACVSDLSLIDRHCHDGHDSWPEVGYGGLPSDFGVQHASSGHNTDDQ